MKTAIVFILLFFPLTGCVFAGSMCDESVTRELKSCAKNNFDLSNKELNSEYSTIMSRFQSRDKDSLRETQRLWIKYKEAYCQAAFDAVSPGEEAAIDKWTCLDSVTRVRLGELQYINSGVSDNSFSRSINFISKTYEGGDISKVITKLGDLPSASLDPRWTLYVEANCKLTYSRLHEEKDVCIARQNFSKDWW